jgi:hypothetical protein
MSSAGTGKIPQKWIWIGIGGIALALALIIVIVVAATSTPVATAAASMPAAAQDQNGAPAQDGGAAQDEDPQAYTEGTWKIVHSTGLILQYDASTLRAVLVTAPAVPTEAQKFRFRATAVADNTLQIQPNASSTAVLALRDDFSVGFNTNTARAWTLTNVQGADGKTYTTLQSSNSPSNGLYLASLENETGSSPAVMDMSNGQSQWTLSPVSS